MERIFEYFNTDKKKTLVALLLQLSEADGQYDDNEIALLKDTGLKMGLSLEEIKLVKKDPGNFHFQLPENINDRMKMLFYLLFMIRVDGKINIKEKEMIKKIGFHLCLNPELIYELLDVLEKYNNQSIPDRLIAEKVKKYLN